MQNSILFKTLLLLAITNYSFAQINNSKFPYSYSLVGKSGNIEKFTAETYDESEKGNVILLGTVDSLSTTVRRLTSSYDQLQYLVFDNFYLENGKLKNEINLQTIYNQTDLPRSGNWGLAERTRLSNNNILVVLTIYHMGQQIKYIHRFMVFDRTGKNLLSQNDYCLLEQPKILVEGDGNFSAVISRDFLPIYLSDYRSIGNARIEGYADLYRDSKPAICIIKFSSDGKTLSKNSYLIHTDQKVRKDQILDITQDIQSNYILISSNLSGVVNQPTLAVVIIERNNPSNFVIKNLYEANAIVGIGSSSLEKVDDKVYANLNRADMRFEINNIQPKKEKTIESKNSSKNTDSEDRVEGNKILADNGIEQPKDDWSKSRGIGQSQRFIRMPHGIIIVSSIETEYHREKPVNYLYKEGQLSVIQELEGYQSSDWSPLANDLLVSKYNVDKLDNTTATKLYTCNMDTWVFTLQVDEGKNIFGRRFSPNYDSIRYQIMVKNPKTTDNPLGVGSELITKSQKIK
ncbi:MAG: hypothetical protein WAU36_18890 [Cyclobacteriaceae bacterium]